MKQRTALFMTTVLSTGFATAQHPHPQPRPAPSTQVYTTEPDGTPLVIVTTPEGLLPKDQNFLLTVDSNLFDSDGNEIPNTEPSRPPQFDANGQVIPGTGVVFNLHPIPSFKAVNPRSPTDDLKEILDAGNAGHSTPSSLQRAIDILEGNPLPGRQYSGFPLLHYNGPKKIRQVTGTNLTVHQIWYDSHIESDTGSIDPTAVWNTPWTITYIIDILSKGADDFAPYIMYFDKPAGPAIGQFGPPNAGMDGTFFPMKEGYRYTIVMNMAPGKYYNLTYTWGWREHPPRVQVSEDAIKMMGAPATARSPKVAPKSLAQWEIDTFTDPVTHQFNKDYAIAQIGELAPEKRMWSDFKQALASSSPAQVKQLLADAMLSFDDWQDRTHLPRGVQADPLADVTLLYVNNTIYGSNGQEGFPKWTTRPAQYNVTLYNGDHYEHGYMNVDFGGARGWENQFQAGFNPQDDTPKGMPASTSTGCTFTFGRHYWWINAGGPWGGIIVDPVEANGAPGKTKVQLNLNFDPPKRLKQYQFDPLHHDVAVFSLH